MWLEDKIIHFLVVLTILVIIVIAGLGGLAWIELQQSATVMAMRDETSAQIESVEYDLTNKINEIKINMKQTYYTSQHLKDFVAQYVDISFLDWIANNKIQSDLFITDARFIPNKDGLSYNFCLNAQLMQDVNPNNFYFNNFTVTATQGQVNICINRIPTKEIMQIAEQYINNDTGAKKFFSFLKYDILQIDIEAYGITRLRFIVHNTSDTLKLYAKRYAYNNMAHTLKYSRYLWDINFEQGIVDIYVGGGM